MAEYFFRVLDVLESCVLNNSQWGLKALVVYVEKVRANYVIRRSEKEKDAAHEMVTVQEAAEDATLVVI